MNIVLLGTAHPFRGGLASFNERLTSEFLTTDNIKIYNFLAILLFLIILRNFYM
jgi:hypothetical protein